MMSNMKDSVIIRERIVHDTVYVTKEVYREAIRQEAIGEKEMRKDTVIVTQWREKVVELPPERYVSKYHRFCSRFFVLVMICGLLFVFWRLKVKLNF